MPLEPTNEVNCIAFLASSALLVGWNLSDGRVSDRAPLGTVPRVNSAPPLPKQYSGSFKVRPMHMPQEALETCTHLAGPLLNPPVLQGGVQKKWPWPAKIFDSRC